MTLHQTHASKANNKLVGYAIVTLTYGPTSIVIVSVPSTISEAQNSIKVDASLSPYSIPHPLRAMSDDNNKCHSIEFRADLMVVVRGKV